MYCVRGRNSSRGRYVLVEHLQGCAATWARPVGPVVGTRGASARRGGEGETPCGGQSRRPFADTAVRGVGLLTHRLRAFVRTSACRRVRGNRFEQVVAGGRDAADLVGEARSSTRSSGARRADMGAGLRGPKPARLLWRRVGAGVKLAARNNGGCMFLAKVLAARRVGLASASP